ncbi:hypothetical protein JK159_08355 [Weissella minor]|uniref:hypothetical protein n=1 Tax=Weissella minor TaxID=1620 RepID=UPI001BB0BC86|nr:hypothetical protein [Weissella minor]MBS0950366.1 hypothetical protein [Weissella minor]
MNLFVNFIQHLFSTVIYFVTHNILALVSIYISFYTLWRTRKSITVTFDPNILLADYNSIYLLKDGEKVYYPYALLANISIVNPSPNDIAFFDLRSFNADTNKNFSFLTTNAIPIDFVDKRVFHESIKDRPAILDIPNRTFGTIKANSFTRLSIVIIPTDLDPNFFTNVTISFKIPKRELIPNFRDPFALSNRKIFKFFGITYHLNIDPIEQTLIKEMPPETKEVLLTGLLTQLTQMQSNKE